MPEQVLLTNGVDEAIHLLCEAYLEPSDEVMVVTPTFGMYEILRRGDRRDALCGCSAADDLRFPSKRTLQSHKRRRRA